METKAQWYWKVTRHKISVMVEILKFCSQLIKRGIRHDLSKYSEIESEGFRSVSNALKESTYGKEVYFNRLYSIGDALSHHYKNNDHHPEHYPTGIKNMSLAALIEMWCDWNAAVRNHNNGDINKSIAINDKRFNIAAQLVRIFKNSV